jgi:hypothetical protein
MKRDTKTPFYDVMCNVNESCVLAVYFNKIIGELETVRIFSSPRTFEDTKKENKDYSAIFYQTVLWELWFHGVVERLNEWNEILNEYFSEYEGKWKFYACSKRIESINEYGGEESDYNEDGSIRTLNLTKDDLRHHTALGEMVQDDWRDIVQETTCADLQYMITCLKAHASFSLPDAFKEFFGKEIATYKQDENGNMVPMSFADKAMDKAVEQYTADGMAIGITLVCEFIQRIIRDIRAMDKFSDNRDKLIQIHKDVRNILDFNLDEVSYVEEMLEEERKSK